MENTVEAARPAETPSIAESPSSVPASLGDRLLGQAVDGAIALGLFFLLGMLLAGRFGGTTEQGFDLTGLPALILISIVVVFMLAYFVLTEAFFGMTLGKVVAEVQVRSPEGQPISMKASVIRNLMRLVDAFPFFPLYLLGAFVVILTSRHLRLGDIAAGTIVVRREQGRGVRAGALALALVLSVGGVWAGFALREAPSTVPFTAAGPISATLAPNVSPNHEPINPTTTFAPETPIIHVAFRVSQAQPGARLKAVWSAVNVGTVAPPNSQLAESTLVLPGPLPGNFRFTRGPQPWPVGDYKVDLYLNDQLVLSLPYRISG
jgi:uncharacterized RDD family membrane protein YckC